MRVGGGWNVTRRPDGGVRFDHYRNVEGVGSVSDLHFELTANEWISLVLEVSAYATEPPHNKLLASESVARVHLGTHVPFPGGRE